MSRSVKLDIETLRERQARIQECLVAPDLELADDYARNDHT